MPALFTISAARGRSRTHGPPTPDEGNKKVMREATVDHLLELVGDAHGAYFGEPVTQLEHALQCALTWRAVRGRRRVSCAALLHDVGHLMADGDDSRAPGYDAIGTAYLRQLGGSDRVASLVAGHVQAKRYLTAVTSEYHGQLSGASKETLAQQISCNCGLGTSGLRIPVPAYRASERPYRLHMTGAGTFVRTPLDVLSP